MNQNWLKLRKKFIDDIKYGSYIDKTNDLNHFHNRGHHLICAPAGYGKTTLLATIGTFYGIHFNDHFFSRKTRRPKTPQEFLDFTFGPKSTSNLNIMRNKNKEIQKNIGSFIPIYFAFPKACPDYFAHFEQRINQVLQQFKPTINYAKFVAKNVAEINQFSELAQRYRERILFSSSVYENLNLTKSKDKDFEKLRFNIEVLMRHLMGMFGRRVIWLLDDCEEAFLAAFLYPNEVSNGVEFLNFFTGINPSIVHGVICSSSRVIPRECFIGGVVVHDFEQNRLDSFGFTREEVEELCVTYQQGCNCHLLFGKCDFIQDNQVLECYNCEFVLGYLKAACHLVQVKRTFLFSRKKYLT